MSTSGDFERARLLADTVLYEGYVLYPYRASSRKNQYRWTFGVLAPRDWSAAGGCEASSLRLQCLVQAPGDFRIDGWLRFLHVERREAQAARGGQLVTVDTLEAGGREHVTWEEGLARDLPFTFGADCDETHVFEIEGARAEEPLGEAGRVVRTRRALSIAVSAASRLVGPELWQLTLTVENATPFAPLDAPRDEAVRAALVGAHLILSGRDGAFVSLVDPPPEARAAAEECRNLGVFPVLAGTPGTRALLLASPIALADYAAIAEESPGESCDGTEIDELLALSTRSLTDEEKRQARATSPRAAEIIDRAERLSGDALEALHGRSRVRSISRGSRVRVRLGSATGPRRSDAQDMFLDGRVGVVEEVREDFDGQTHLAVILDDDPAADLHRWYGRHLHFRPDEVELLEPAP